MACFALFGTMDHLRVWGAISEKLQNSSLENGRETLESVSLKLTCN